MKRKPAARTTRRLLAPWLGVALGGCSLAMPAAPSSEEVGSKAWQNDRHDRAKAMLAQGNYGLAVEGFREALRYDPYSVKSLNGLAAAYDMLGRHDLAQRYYREALLVKPDSIETLNNQGYSFILSKQFDDARRALERARALDRENARVAANLNELDRREVAAAKAGARDDARQAAAGERARRAHAKRKMWVERASERVQVLVTKADSALAQWAKSVDIEPRWLRTQSPSVPNGPAPVLAVATRGPATPAVVAVTKTSPRVDALPPVAAAPRAPISRPVVLTISSAAADKGRVTAPADGPLVSVVPALLSSPADVPAAAAAQRPIALIATPAAAPALHRLGASPDQPRVKVIAEPPPKPPVATVTAPVVKPAPKIVTEPKATAPAEPEARIVTEPAAARSARLREPAPPPAGIERAVVASAPAPAPVAAAAIEAEAPAASVPAAIVPAATSATSPAPAAKTITPAATAVAPYAASRQTARGGDHAAVSTGPIAVEPDALLAPWLMKPGAAAAVEAEAPAASVPAAIVPAATSATSPAPAAKTITPAATAVAPYAASRQTARGGDHAAVSTGPIAVEPDALLAPWLMKPGALYARKGGVLTFALAEARPVKAAVALRGRPDAVTAPIAAPGRPFVPFALVQGGKAADETNAAAPVLEIANGNDRLAAMIGLRDRLRAANLGLAPVNIAAAAGGDTVLYYRPGREDAAKKLLASLSFAPPMRSDPTLTSDMRLVIGDDVLDYDRLLLGHQLVARADP